MPYIGFNQLFVIFLFLSELFFCIAQANASDIQEGEIILPAGNNVINEQSINLPAGSKKTIVEGNIPIKNTAGHSETIIDESINVPDLHDDEIAIKEKLSKQEDINSESGYIENSALKLGHGALDIVTSILEIPKTIVKTTREDGIALGLSMGVIKGIANTAEQAVSGAANMVTFPIPQKIEIDVVENPGDEFNMEETFGSAFSDDDRSKL